MLVAISSPTGLPYFQVQAGLVNDHKLQPVTVGDYMFRNQEVLLQKQAHKSNAS